MIYMKFCIILVTILFALGLAIPIYLYLKELWENLKK